MTERVAASHPRLLTMVGMRAESGAPQSLRHKDQTNMIGVALVNEQPRLSLRGLIKHVHDMFWNPGPVAMGLVQLEHQVKRTMTPPRRTKC
jgi:hypothetical protein